MSLDTRIGPPSKLRSSKEGLKFFVILEKWKKVSVQFCKAFFLWDKKIIINKRQKGNRNRNRNLEIFNSFFKNVENRSNIKCG